MVADEEFVRQSLVHALLSPLTVILGSLDMLLNQENAWPGYAVEILELALAQAQRLQEALDTLLSTAEVKDNTVLLSWSLPIAPAGDRQPRDQAEKPAANDNKEPG
jgi:signal transduction histidine kinase